MPTLAWSARNFLELSIWIEYCCASEQKAARFKVDTSRDLFGLIAASRRDELEPQLREDIDDLLRRLERIFNTKDFKVTDQFKRVAEAAAEVGREGEFFSLNKIFSKMVHPTAFVVNLKKQKPFDRGFQATIYIAGVQLALKSMIVLVNFLFTNFPKPII